MDVRKGGYVARADAMEAVLRTRPEHLLRGKHCAEVDRAEPLECQAN